MTDEELELLTEHYLERFTHRFPTGRSFVDFGYMAHRRENPIIQLLPLGIDPVVEGSDRSVYGEVTITPVRMTRVITLSRDEIDTANRQFDAAFRRSIALSMERIISSFDVSILFDGFQSRYPNSNQPRIPNNTEKAGPAEQSWKDWLKESEHKQKVKQASRG